MPRKAIHAPRQNNVVSDTKPGPTTPRIFASSTSAAPTILTADSALTTYTSYSTSTFVSAGITYKQSQGVPVVVSNSAEFTSLSAAGAFNTEASPTATTAATTNGTASAAAATSSAASTHKSSSTKTSTLIPAIVVPVVIIILLASFGAFFFFMRRRHHRALEEEARFEKIKPKPSPSSADNSSSRNLLPAGAGFGHSADEKPKQGTNVQVRPLPVGQATNPPRPRRPDENDIPRSAIGIARSTSSASAVPAKHAPRPPRSAHEMRGLPPNPRLNNRGPRPPVLSGGDIIDSYAAMRPSTAPNGSGRDPPSQSNTFMRTPLPIKPQGRPPPKNPSPLPPQYTSNSTAQSPSSRTASPALWPASSQARNSPALSGAQPGTPDSSYGLTEENLRIARLVNGSSSSPGMARQMPDNASISDVDEHDDARAGRDDGSDISELDEEQERMASGMNSPMETGRGTPMSGRVGTPMSGRGFAR
jgi:hypothetical protein